MLPTIPSIFTKKTEQLKKPSMLSLTKRNEAFPSLKLEVNDGDPITPVVRPVLNKYTVEVQQASIAEDFVRGDAFYKIRAWPKALTHDLQETGWVQSDDGGTGVTFNRTLRFESAEEIRRINICCDAVVGGIENLGDGDAIEMGRSTADLPGTLRQPLTLEAFSLGAVLVDLIITMVA